MGFFQNLFGDITKATEEIVPGASNIDKFLNKAGAGPADILNNPFKPKGWAGDIEHGFSQATHDPGVRTAAEIAAAVAAAYFGGEALLPYLTSAGDAAAGAGVAADAATAGDVAATSYGADLAAETATAADTAATTDAAATAADAAATAAGTGIPEVTINAAALPQAVTPGALAFDPSTALASLSPLATLAQSGQLGPTAAQTAPTAQADATTQPADVNPAPGSPEAQLLEDLGVSGGDVPFVAPDAGTVAGGTGDFAGQIGGATGAQDFGVLSEDPTFMQSLTNADLGGGDGGFGSSLAKFFSSPRNDLGIAGLGMNLYGLLNRPKLPSAANTALGAAGPAVSQAQSVIASGGMGPLWNTQKTAIDAQIDQQIDNMTKAIQQSNQNTSGQGSNSAAVQALIASATSDLNAKRQQMYQAALQQNVSTAVAELTGANQTLMSIANLQLEEDRYAQELAASLGATTSKLATLFPA